MSMNHRGADSRNGGNHKGSNRSGQNRAGQGRSGANRGQERRTSAHGNSENQPEFKRGGGGETRRNTRGHERNRKSQHQRDFSSSAPSSRQRKADGARLVAFETINQVALEDSYANLVLPKMIRAHRLDHRDAGFATELTYGTLRNQGTYDAILAHCVDRPLEKTGAKILTALRIGTHQLLAMRVPAHAALNQTVALARAEIGSGPASFINAVLRRVSERTVEQWQELIETEAADELTRLALAKSHPAWIVRAFRQALATHGRSPQEIEQLLDADNAAPTVNLVALPGIGSLTEAQENGAVEGELVSGSAHYSGGDLARLESVREGQVRAQDVGSQLVARALAFAPLEGRDENWLDLCAGPGGKAALLGALGLERGASLVANESAAHRARLVEQSMKPLPAEQYSVVTGDGRKIERTVANPRNLPAAMRQQAGSAVLFDRVMVDVPCSGLGALRRRPEARWRKTPRDIAELTALQKELFVAAVGVTRPGGLIAYVTCSPHAAETQTIVLDLLKTASVELLDSGEALRNAALKDDSGESVLAGEKDPAAALTVKTPGVTGQKSTTAQLWPHVHGTDAMFLALFRKK